jgi:hypothetical protein
MTSSHGFSLPSPTEVIMNKASCFSLLALCLGSLTATAGTITQSASLADPSAPALHLLAMSASDQLDLALWDRGVAAARELPALWHGAVFNGPVASVRSAAASAVLATESSPSGDLFAPGPSPFSFMLLASGLALGSYTLRRTRLSALAACG